jgi:FMN phosphatase YigB (HAD superfamily)
MNIQQTIQKKTQTSVKFIDKTPHNTILTDVDGVLLDWSTEFERFMKRRGHRPLPDTSHHYRLSLRYPDLNDAEVHTMVDQFNKSDYLRYLPPWKDAVEYVRKLNGLGYQFVCITAMSSHKSAIDHRKYNLDSLFGPGVFDHNHMVCLSVGSSKHNALSTWQGKNFWWVDDHFRHAESGYELGLRSILMNHSHNEHFRTDLFPRANSWEEIYDMIVNDNYESYMSRTSLTTADLST